MQLDLFADPTTAPVTITGAVATIASLPEGTPHVAEAIALSLCNYNGIAARLFQRFMHKVLVSGRRDLVRGRFYPVSYDEGVKLLNMIVRGKATMQAPTAADCIKAADQLHQFCIVHRASEERQSGKVETLRADVGRVIDAIRLAREDEENPGEENADYASSSAYVDLLKTYWVCYRLAMRAKFRPVSGMEVDA